MNILVAKNGSQLGPFSETDIRAKLASGEFSPTDYAWHEGLTAWTALSQLLGNAPAPSPLAPPATPSVSAQPSYAPQPYSTPQGQNVPGVYGSQPSNSPYPTAYQPGAMQAWGGPRASNYAGFWRRFLAYVIDVIILYIPLFIIGIVAALLVGGRSGLGSSDLADNPAAGFIILAIYLLYFVGVWFYFAAMESSARQATFGKMAIGLKVTDLDGNRIGFGNATGRFFSRILSGFFFGIGYMMAGFTERKQALHDMIASTLVVMK